MLLWHTSFSLLSKHYGREDIRVIFAGIEEKVNLWKNFNNNYRNCIWEITKYIPDNGNKQWGESGQRTSSRQQAVFTGGVINVYSVYSYIYNVSITNKCFQKFVLGIHELKVFRALVSLRTIHRITEYLGNHRITWISWKGCTRITKAIFWPCTR